uniref:Putative secreted protein n=1 Tax=Anopheles darlingi TaxID=43151 RepID=A0A2M4DDJ8_ANODA
MALAPVVVVCWHVAALGARRQDSGNGPTTLPHGHVALWPGAARSQSDARPGHRRDASCWRIHTSGAAYRPPSSGCGWPSFPYRRTT